MKKPWRKSLTTLHQIVKKSEFWKKKFHIFLDKSRLLKCFSEDDMDFCNVDGQNLPVIKFYDDDDDDNDSIGLLQIQMDKMKVMDEPEYKQGTMVNIAQTVLNNNQETNASEVQL